MQASKYPGSEAWTLVGRCVSVFFTTLATKRAGASLIDTLEAPEDRALLIWTNMQSLNLAGEIIGKGFQSHPAILQEIMQFQLEHRVDASQLVDVSTIVDAMKTSVKTVTDKVARMERAASETSDKVKKTAQDLGNLRTEVSKLKKG